MILLYLVQLLGDLPSFKASRNNPLTTGSTNSLSTALDSLLGDSSTEKSRLCEF